MKRYVLMAGLVVLASCATVLTPQRCAQIDTAASTVEQIAAVFVATGTQPERARKLAGAVKAGQLIFAEACRQARASEPPPVSP